MSSQNYITYHQSVKRPEDVQNTIPYVLLAKFIQDKLIEFNCVQKAYYFSDNGFYWFLYLDNGDRVDIQL